MPTIYPPPYRLDWLEGRPLTKHSWRLQLEARLLYIWGFLGGCVCVCVSDGFSTSPQWSSAVRHPYNGLQATHLPPTQVHRSLLWQWE